MLERIITHGVLSAKIRLPYRAVVIWPKNWFASTCPRVLCCHGNQFRPVSEKQPLDHVTSRDYWIRRNPWCLVYRGIGMLGLRGFAGLNSTNKYWWNSHTIKGNVGKRVIYMVGNCIAGATARIGQVLKSVKYGNRRGWFLVFLNLALYISLV